MKILLINQFFYPDQVATSQMMTDLAVNLAAMGNEVSVLTSRSAYLSNDAQLARFQEYRGVKIYRTFSTRFGKGTTVGRVVDYLSFYLSVFIKAFFLKKHDVVITLSSPPLIALVGVILKYARGCKFIYWVQDLYPEVAIRLGFLKEESVVTRVSKQISKFILRRADHVVAIGESMKSLLMLKGIKENHLSVIHNWSDGKEIVPVRKEDNPFVKEHGLIDRFVVLYSGNMGHPHPMRAILDAAKELSWNKRFLFLFVGDGARKKEIETFVEKESLSNVRMLPYQPREILKYSLGSADVHVMSLLEGMEGLLVPSKIYGIMASGRPVIFLGSQKSDVGEIIKNARGGYVVSPNDSPQLVKYLALMEHLPEMAKKLGDNNRQAFEKMYDRPLALRKFASLLDSSRVEGGSSK